MTHTLRDLLRRHRTMLLALVVFAVGGSLASQTATDVGPSTHTREPQGLRALLRYVQGQGVHAEQWTRRLQELDGDPGTLVVAAPLAEAFDAADRAALVALLDAGWRVVYLSSGAEAGAAEQLLLAELGLRAARSAEPPLAPWAWRAWRLEDATMVPSSGDHLPLAGAPTTHAVLPPAGHTSWFETPSGVPMVFSVPRGGGELVVIHNASVWGNAWLSEPGNLALAERLLGEQVTERVVFDEWHHGHRADTKDEVGALVGPILLFTLHLFWIYVGAAWAVSRPFGAAARTAGYVAGATRRDLLAIASLHRRSGHAPQAGRRLLALTRSALARRGAEAPDLPETFDGDADALVGLAHRVADLQREHRL